MSTTIDHDLSTPAGVVAALADTESEIAMFTLSRKVWSDYFGRPWPGESYARTMLIQRDRLRARVASERKS